MMTGPMQPLGLSFWQLTASRPMCEAAGRLFVDVAPLLASPTSRAHYVEALGRSDPLIGDALETILERGDFVATRTDEDQDFTPIFGTPALDGDEPRHRHGADRARPGLPRRRTARHPDQVGTGSPRLHHLGHRGAEADHVRSRGPSGDQDRHRRLAVDQRADGGLAGREERRRHAHAVRAPQRHVGDGTRPPRRGGCDPSAPRRGRLPAPGGRRRVPGHAPRPRRAGKRRRVPLLAYLDTYGMRCIGEIDITQDAVERTPLRPPAHDPLERHEFRAG